MKELVIAEKPSVARDIANVIGANKRQNGYLEGECYIVTWAIGHLVTLLEPKDYHPSLKRWDYQTLPIIPLEMSVKPFSKTESQLKVIERLMERTDVTGLICATDSGREGELIFRYVYAYLQGTKPVKRLWISSMTAEAIGRGFEELRPATDYDSLYQSAKCRSEADWLVGINGTRAYTTKNNVLLSIGRVQTPTLALVVQRQEEIDDFKPQPYVELVADFGIFKGTWFEGKISETKLFERSKAEDLAQKIADGEGQITSVEKKKQRQKPPLLYDLTELQRDGNKLYGFTADKVLKIAQALYEKHKLVTYPRTDSRYLSQDMKKEVLATMRLLDTEPFHLAISELYGSSGQLEKLAFNKRIINDQKVTDHHAIIPTKRRPMVSGLSESEKKIYYLVVKRLIAVFYPDYEYQTTKIISTVKDETFITKGKIVLKQGWKKLYQSSKTKTKANQEQELPAVRKNTLVKVMESQLLEKETTPPKPYTEASLLSAMENAGRYVEDEELKEQLKESGFGTAATRASIIERLIAVKYMYRNKKNLHPTAKGKKLIKIVPKELTSPETTGKWERGLSKIQRRELEPEIFMGSIKKFVRYIVKKADVTKNQVYFETTPVKRKKSHSR